jgi:hypothetical protein
MRCRLPGAETVNPGCRWWRRRAAPSGPVAGRVRRRARRRGLGGCPGGDLGAGQPGGRAPVRQPGLGRPGRATGHGLPRAVRGGPHAPGGRTRPARPGSAHDPARGAAFALAGGAERLRPARGPVRLDMPDPAKMVSCRTVPARASPGSLRPGARSFPNSLAAGYLKALRSAARSNALHLLPPGYELARQRTR